MIIDRVLSKKGSSSTFLLIMICFIFVDKGNTA